MTEGPAQQLDQMITAYWMSQAIYAAAKFGIADHLKDGPKSIEQLAEATSTNPEMPCIGSCGRWRAKESSSKVSLASFR